VVVFAGKGENVEKSGKPGTTSSRQRDSSDRLETRGLK